jgi:hypothetical protein
MAIRLPIRSGSLGECVNLLQTNNHQYDVGKVPDRRIRFAHNYLTVITVQKDLPWFRFYKDAVDDAKLRMLAFEDRWHFVALLCCKAQGLLDADADLQRMRRKVGVKLGVDSMTLDEIERRLVVEGLIEPKTLQPIAWAKRQFRSDADPTNASRQARHRERLQHSNGQVTGLDTEADTDKEEGGKPPSRAGKRRYEYSADFETAWSLYPRRPNNNKLAAWSAWQARLRAGAAVIDMIDGVKRYQVFCKARAACERNFAPEYIQHAATFFGPKEPFRLEWSPPTPIASARSAQTQHRSDWNARDHQRTGTYPMGGQQHVEPRDNVIDI